MALKINIDTAVQKEYFKEIALFCSRTANGKGSDPFDNKCLRSESTGVTPVVTFSVKWVDGVFSFTVTSEVTFSV